MNLKSLLFRLFFFLQIHHLSRHLLRHKLFILTYHGFTENPDRGNGWNDDGKHVWIRNFEAQIKYLMKYYRPVSLSRWLEEAKNGGRRLPYSVVLTFDDGYRSNYSLAFPILKKYGVPATIFLATDFVAQHHFLWTDRLEYAVLNCAPGQYPLDLRDGAAAIPVDCRSRDGAIASLKNLKSLLKKMAPSRRDSCLEKIEALLGRPLTAQNTSPEYAPLDWNHLKEMASEGLVSFGSHTHSHAILSRCGEAEVRTELARSRDLIEKNTGAESRLFCYPNGQAGDFNESTRKALVEGDFSCGLTTVEGVNDRLSDAYELKRVGVRDQTDFIEFAMTLSGIKWFFSEMKARLKKSVTGGSSGSPVGACKPR
jgi:peptidoglycan/xylan/chitin deacetylase (PgdA/CDA1 family)